MAMVVFQNVQELAARAGQEVAVSEWLKIDQKRINLFADATNDHQWIHVDVERAKIESPFKAPVAHGYLTMSMVAGFFNESIRVDGVKQIINYGLNKARFSAPVVVDSRIRCKFTVKECQMRGRSIMQVLWDANVEIENQSKPACVAEMIILYYV